MRFWKGDINLAGTVGSGTVLPDWAGFCSIGLLLIGLDRRITHSVLPTIFNGKLLKSARKVAR